MIYKPIIDKILAIDQSEIIYHAYGRQRAHGDVELASNNFIFAAGHPTGPLENNVYCTEVIIKYFRNSPSVVPM